MLASIAQQMTRVELSIEPRSTLTIVRWGGGNSINAIPQEAWIEIDTRCAADAELESLEAAVRAIVVRATEGRPELHAEIAQIGSRPAARTDPQAPLAQAAFTATRSLDRAPILTVSSTDSNIPMSLRIPAITMGCGGEAGIAYTTDEWYRNPGSPTGIIRALYTVLLTAELP